MSKDKQIEEIKEKQIEEMARKNCHFEYHMKNYKTCKECYEDNYRACRVYEVCRNLYNAGYRKQSEPISCDHENGGEWISVEDRLPERPGKYLVYTVKGATKLGEFCSYLVDDEPQFDWYVTHWMPLPEPPKMKGGDSQ